MGLAFPGSAGARIQDRTGTPSDFSTIRGSGRSSGSEMCSLATCWLRSAMKAISGATMWASRPASSAPRAWSRASTSTPAARRRAGTGKHRATASSPPTGRSPCDAWRRSACRRGLRAVVRDDVAPLPGTCSSRSPGARSSVCFGPSTVSTRPSASSPRTWSTSAAGCQRPRVRGCRASGSDPGSVHGSPGPRVPCSGRRAHVDLRRARQRFHRARASGPAPVPTPTSAGTTPSATSSSRRCSTAPSGSS